MQEKTNGVKRHFLVAGFDPICRGLHSEIFRSVPVRETCFGEGIAGRHAATTNDPRRRMVIQVNRWWTTFVTITDSNS